MQCIDQRVVHLQHGFATSENDKALTLCLAPELKRRVSQRLCACKFAATLAPRADALGVAETADSFRAVLLPAYPQVAACQAPESRGASCLPPLSLNGGEHFLDGVTDRKLA